MIFPSSDPTNETGRECCDLCGTIGRYVPPFRCPELVLEHVKQAEEVLPTHGAEAAARQPQTPGLCCRSIGSEGSSVPVFGIDGSSVP